MQETYQFDLEKGRIQPAEMDKTEKSKAVLYIERISLEKFKNLAGDLPHKRNLYRSMSPVQVCKIETYEECVQGTLRIPRSSKGKIGIQSFGFYLRGKNLMIVEDGSVAKNLLAKMQGNLYGTCTANQVILLLFESMIEEDILYLQQQEEKLSAIEEGLLRKIPEDFYEIIIQYRKQFSAYHAYYEQLMNIGAQMQSDIGQKLTIEERNGWQLYGNRAERLHNQVELLREYLIQIRELYQSQIDIQQNKVMSILTVVTTIFLPLTLIAGWYGMNFPNMPEFQWEYAYLAVIMVSVGIIILEVLFFKKKKML